MLIQIASFGQTEMQSITEQIQTHSYKVGQLSTQISQDVGNSIPPHIEVIKLHMQKCIDFNREMPPTMHLAALGSDNASYLSGIQRRSLLLVHLLYLGAVTLMHRRLLVYVAEGRLPGNQNVVITEEIKGYHDYCLLTAQQAAGVAKVILDDGTLPKQCWVAVYQAFGSSSILLFFIAQKLLHRNHDRLDDDFIYAEHCIQLLEWCSTVETLAARYVGIVRPIFDGLKTLYIQGSVRTPGSPTPVREDVLPLAKQMNRILIDPYGVVQMAEMSPGHDLSAGFSHKAQSPTSLNWFANPAEPLLRARDMTG